MFDYNSLSFLSIIPVKTETENGTCSLGVQFEINKICIEHISTIHCNYTIISNSDNSIDASFLVCVFY